MITTVAVVAFAAGLKMQQVQPHTIAEVISSQIEKDSIGVNTSIDIPEDASKVELEEVQQVQPQTVAEGISSHDETDSIGVNAKKVELEEAVGEQSPRLTLSIAAFHDPSNVDLDYGVHVDALSRYLKFDDGYSSCITEEAAIDDRNGVRKLKKAKWSILRDWADQEDRWSIALKSSRYSPSNLGESTVRMASTCRLISLTHEDYDGMAASVLHDIVSKGNSGIFTIDVSDLRFSFLPSRYLFFGLSFSLA